MPPLQRLPPANPEHLEEAGGAGGVGTAGAAPHCQPAPESSVPPSPVRAPQLPSSGEGLLCLPGFHGATGTGIRLFPARSLPAGRGWVTEGDRAAPGSAPAVGWEPRSSEGVGEDRGQTSGLERKALLHEQLHSKM